MGTGKDLWNEFETLYSKHDYRGLASLFAEDALYVTPDGRREGPEAIEAYLEETDKPFSDIRIETSLVIEEGDSVVAEWVWRATHTGPLVLPDGKEIAPADKTVELAVATVARIRGGMFVSMREYLDMVELMTQLGLMAST